MSFRSTDHRLVIFLFLGATGAPGCSVAFNNDVSLRRGGSTAATTSTPSVILPLVAPNSVTAPRRSGLASFSVSLTVPLTTSADFLVRTEPISGATPIDDAIPGVDYIATDQTAHIEAGKTDFTVGVGLVKNFASEIGRPSIRFRVIIEPQGTAPYTSTSVDVTIPEGPHSQVVQLASGSGYTCALLSTGQIRCWGRQDQGGLGIAPFNTQRWKPQEFVQGIMNAVSIAASGPFTCAVLQTGRASCWGNGSNGQLGNGNTTSQWTPTPVLDSTGLAPLENVAQIAAGQNHTCALLQSGQILCWGSRSAGKIGNGGTTTGNQLSPVAVSGIDGVSTKAVSVTAGDNGTCAILQSGEVRCWGTRATGNIGDGGATTGAQTTPTQVSGLDGSTPSAAATALSMASSGGTTCALLQNGQVECWGYGSFGALGNGNTANSSVPVAVLDETGSAPLSQVISIDAGHTHTCVRLQSNKMQCWGFGTNGILGNGVLSHSSLPVTVVDETGTAPLQNVSLIAAGGWNSCALTTDTNQVWCWGQGSDGQLGNNSSTSIQATPVGVIENAPTFYNKPLHAPAFPGGQYLNRISMGASHSCALTVSGAVLCWGDRTSGQLGDGGSITGSQSGPATVSGIDGVNLKATEIAAGDYFSCAILQSGEVRCWGDDSGGQLGDGGSGTQNAPVSVSGIDGVSQKAIAIATGASHSCAILQSGQVLCWGDNSYGQLGDGSGMSQPAPSQVFGIDGITQKAISIAAGTVHSCAVLDSGQVLCWGDNSYGQLGDGSSFDFITTGTFTPSAVPVPVVGIDGTSLKATAVSVSYSHSCAVLTSGKMLCWGDNDYGQLGDAQGSVYYEPAVGDLFYYTSVPVSVAGIDGISERALSLATSSGRTCAVMSSGEVQCWGYRDSGALGDGDDVTAFQNTPHPVLGIDGISQKARVVSTGPTGSACSLLESGQLLCWGNNGQQQLGVSFPTGMIPAFWSD